MRLMANKAYGAQTWVFSYAASIVSLSAVAMMDMHSGQMES
jgi:hypothetical protein